MAAASGIVMQINFSGEKVSILKIGLQTHASGGNLLLRPISPFGVFFDGDKILCLREL